MLHIDLWQTSRGFLYTGYTCVNRQTQMRGLNRKSVGVVKLNIHGYPRFIETVLDTRSGSKKIWRTPVSKSETGVTKTISCYFLPCLDKSQSDKDVQLYCTYTLHWTNKRPEKKEICCMGNYSSPGREAEKVLSGILKITHRSMVKRRSYGSIQQTVVSSARLSHIPQKLQPLSRMKCEM